MTHLFEILHSDFFRPLSGPNRQKYADIISLIWDYCKRSPSFSEDKSTLLNWIEDYFDGSTDDISPDPEDEFYEEYGISSNSRKNATAFIRRLKDTGWLEERNGGYGEEAQIFINNRAIPIVRAFQDVISPRLITYKGKLSKIYMMLGGIGESESPYESILREVSIDLDDLNASLRQLSSSIGGYIDELTKGKMPEEVLNLFDHYEEQVVVGAYHRFKTNDNLFYYRSELNSYLEDCQTKYFVKLTNDYSNVERASDDEASVAIGRMIYKIKEDLREMGEIMKAIDANHLLYRSRAVQRAQFLLLSDGTVKSKINKLLQYISMGISESEDLFSYENGAIGSIFQVFPHFFFETGSIKSPIIKKKTTPIEQLKEVTPSDPEELRRSQELLMLYVRNAVTSENVNRFAEKVLRDIQSTTAGILIKEYKETNEIVKIIGLHTYSTSDSRKYDIVLKPGLLEYDGLRFQDFTVRRKG